MHRITAFVLACSLFACRSASSGAAGAPEGASGAYRDEILAMMRESAAAWNRGDLDRFVDDYVDSERTSFVGSRGLLHGRAAIRAAYAPRFAPGGQRDSLSFRDVEVDPLAPGVAHVVATYVLARGDSVTAHGPTSLVMLRRDGRWRIVHDHSS